MSNKKHIDRLFQEKFKDFDVKPDSKIWENIQDEIAPKKEKKKRVIPIWFKYGGIAALLLLFLTAGITVFNSTSNPETIVDTKLPTTINTKDKNLNKNKNTILNTPVISSNNNNVETYNNETKTVSKEDEIKTATSSQAPIASTGIKTDKHITSKNKYSTPKEATKLNHTAAVNTNSYKSSNNSSAYKKQDESNLIGDQNNSTKTNPLNGVAVISNSNVQKTTNTEKDINNAINAVKDDTFSSTVAQSKSSNKNKINETLKDSVSTNAIENAIAEAKNESKKEKIKKKEAASKKWTVNANVAPVYYNTLGKGSHIDQQFIDNKKTGAINTSYGINVGYAINDKLKIRSGVNSLNLGYDTDNVVIYESVANSGRGPNTLKNLEMPSFSVNGTNIAVVSGEKINTNQFESFSPQEFKTTSLKQQINYVEIPVELEYALINKRFGVNVIGGMSTFILGNNDVSTELRGTTTQIGTVNNINEISFSTNIGLGIGYDFSKAFKLNLEPTFKYQINAFDDTAGNFNPFILGIYTGLSYKF